MKTIQHKQLGRLQRPTFAVLFAFTLAVALVGHSQPAHQVQRPVFNDDGQLNQAYLWATEWTTPLGIVLQHRGLDFPNPLGTEVFVVANGVVVDMEEGIPNGTFPANSTRFGNFVLIRHNALLNHYDQTSDTTAYAYTIYAHLRQDSVIPDVGDTVTAGTHIADIDSTGNSSGHHLHFQVVLNPSTDLDNIKLDPNTLDSENRSRNPELWLAPYPGTGAAIGQVSDSNGNPVGNLVVCGIQKQAPTTGYVSSRTYSFPWANPDDILHENFGTTDVRPGTYYLYAANLATGCGGAHVYNLGNYSFTAGRSTYIGLYPAWLPVVKPAVAQWDAEMFIRNHDSAQRNVSFTTYTYPASYIYSGQRDRTSNLQGTSVIADEPNKSFTGIVVPNRDSSVLIISRYNGQPIGYSGITAINGLGSAGWERGGTTLFVPLVKDHWVNRSSEIYVTNIGAGDARINVTYYNQAGVSYQGSQNLIVRPNQRTALNPPAHVPANGYYSAKITNSSGYDQPLAAVVLENTTSGSSYEWPAAYNAFSSGNTVLFAPLVKKNYVGGTSGIVIQNTSSSFANFQAIYYNMNGIQQGQPIVGTIAPYSPYVLYNPSQIPDGFLGSVRIMSTSGQSLVGQLSEVRTTGSIEQMMSNLAIGGTTVVHLPVWYDNYTATGGNWESGVNDQNAGIGVNNITATWYDLAGNPVLARNATLANTYDTHNFYDDPALVNFVGSLVIRSTSNIKIVAVCNIMNIAASSNTDRAMAFNGSNR